MDRAVPIYEFACQRCKKIYSFLSKRVNPEKIPTCPKCGNPNMIKQVSRFAFLKGRADSVKEVNSPEDESLEDGPRFTKQDEARMMSVMSELEKDIDYLDENNPRHLAYMMKKFKEAMPPGIMPKEIDVAIRRLEAGEDPEKIEEDMGDVLSELFGPYESGEYDEGFGGYSRDETLYEM